MSPSSHLHTISFMLRTHLQSNRKNIPELSLVCQNHRISVKKQSFAAQLSSARFHVSSSVFASKCDDFIQTLDCKRALKKILYIFGIFFVFNTPFLAFAASPDILQLQWR